MVVFLAAGGTAAAASPGSTSVVNPPGAPDILVTSDCDLDGTGFMDVDADGIDDLVMNVDERLYLWPSSLEGTVWFHDFPAVEEPWSDILFTGARATTEHGAQVQWKYGSYTEYVIDPSTGSVSERWTDVTNEQYTYYAGDVDGDGWSDLVDTDDVRLSSTGVWQEVPDAVLYWEYTNSVGDLNGDGYDDLLVAWREDRYDYGSFCMRHRGPGDLYLGTPTGIAAPPLWQIYALGLPNTGLGRFAAAVAGHDVLIVTIVEEGFLCAAGDIAPGFLGLIVNASTPEASLEQVVPVDQLDLYDEMPFLAATLGNEVVLVEPARVQFFTFDPKTQRLSVGPTAEWDLVDRITDWRHYTLPKPPGRAAQALAYGSYVLSTGEYELLVWGRTVDDVGPTVHGSSPDDVCTFWSAPYVEPDPPPTTTTTDTGTTVPPAPPTDAESPPEIDIVVPQPPTSSDCGCRTDTFGGGVVPTLLVIAALRRPRRSGRRCSNAAATAGARCVTDGSPLLAVYRAFGGGFRRPPRPTRRSARCPRSTPRISRTGS